MEPEPELFKYPEVCLNTDLILPQFENLCEELICSICLNLVWDPIACIKCTSPFGKKCLESWLKRDNRCPIENSIFEGREVTSLTRRLMSKIQLYCSNKQYGCNEIVDYEDFYKHSNSCKYMPYKCPYKECNVRGKRNEMLSHMRVCKFKVVILENLIHFDDNILESIAIGLDIGKGKYTEFPVNNKSHHSNNNNIVNIVNQPIESNNNSYKSSFSNHYIYNKCPEDFAKNMNKNFEYANLINKEYMSSNLQLFKDLITNNDPENSGGLLYKDHNLVIDIEPKVLGKAMFGLLVTFNSIMKSVISNLIVTVSHTSEFSLQTSKPKYLDNTTAQVLIRFGLIDSFSNPPKMIFSCNLNNHTYSDHILALPIFITKFILRLPIKYTDIIRKWKKYTNNIEERYHKLDCILKSPFTKKRNAIMSFLKKIGSLLYCLGFNVLTPQDTLNYNDIIAAGCLVAADGDIPIFIQISFVPEYNKEFRLSIRAKVPDPFKFITLTLDIYSVLDFFVNFKK